MYMFRNGNGFLIFYLYTRTKGLRVDTVVPTSLRESETRCDRRTVMFRKSIPMSGICLRCTLATRLRCQRENNVNITTTWIQISSQKKNQICTVTPFYNAVGHAS